MLLAFIRLSRPLFLYGGFAGVALGAAVAHAAGLRLDVAAYVWVQALVTSFQLMVHYANDYFDREADAHATRTAWSGGSGVLTAHMLSPRVALVAALVCAALGLVVTARFALAGNAPVAWLGLAIGVLAWCYSAPPVRFAARGLGELDAALVVAVLVPLAGFAAFAQRIGEAMNGAVTTT
ncbi:MAG: prenyltransferase, partial [Candidatus Eremiobacteraeota bacterium]|nr:prenyltransferase [Candidatus Eremiobacteraeota bacterium]